MRTGTMLLLRVIAGIGLLTYAGFAFSKHGHGAGPLVPALVGAYLLIRAVTLTSRNPGDQ